jgi:hypothetical protein
LRNFLTRVFFFNKISQYFRKAIRYLFFITLYYVAKRKIAWQRRKFSNTPVVGGSIGKEEKKQGETEAVADERIRTIIREELSRNAQISNEHKRRVLLEYVPEKPSADQIIAQEWLDQLLTLSNGRIMRPMSPKFQSKAQE